MPSGQIRNRDGIDRMAHVIMKGPLWPQGLKVATFFTRSYARPLRPGLAEITEPFPPARSALRTAFDRVHRAIDQRREDLKLAA